MHNSYIFQGPFSPVFFARALRRFNITCLVRAIGTALIFTLLTPLAAAQTILLPTTELSIEQKTVYAEVAATGESRTLGLMNRRSLLPDHGMLFVFERQDMQCFWMKNTPLPLSIAFIDKGGIILNIANMQPQSEDVHCPVGPVLFALEMEQGWFAANKIKAGQKVTGLPQR